LPLYAACGVFTACALVSLVFALVNWSGDGSARSLAGVIGIVLSGRITGNIDFGISATMTVACTTFTLALLLLARLAFARWALVLIGAVVAVYYLYAVGYLVSHDAAGLAGVPAVAALMWGGATVLAALPPTTRALRRMW
jgi:hypothetical protein